MIELFNLHSDHVFLRREALAFGYVDRDLRDALRSGVLTRIRHGAYTPASVWDAADEAERHRLRSHAVLRSHSSALALSHTSAAVEHGLRLHQADLRRVHVTCLDTQLAKTTPDVVYHRAPVPEGDLQLGSGGEMVVIPVRAGLEAATLTNVAGGLVILDSLVDQDHATVDDVLARYCSFSAPGSRRLQLTVRLVRKGANSAGESLSRHMFWSQHLPEPVLQFEVRDEHGVLVGRSDFAWPELGLLGEFDGRMKYLRMRRKGETIEEAVLREKAREDRLRELTNWLMVRLVWADLFRPEATAAHVRRKMRQGRRFAAA